MSDTWLPILHTLIDLEGPAQLPEALRRLEGKAGLRAWSIAVELRGENQQSIVASTDPARQVGSRVAYELDPKATAPTLVSDGFGLRVLAPIRFEGDFIGTLSAHAENHPAPLLIQFVQVAAALIRRSVASAQRRLETAGQPSLTDGVGRMLGRSNSLRPVFELINTVAESDATVLIRGETGVGKELVADDIQRLSKRRDTSYVKVNCAAIPQSLLESELFGHEAGAFTGATYQRKGRFELADNGTLLLDEIGDIPLPTQIALLRTLQTGEYQRVGGVQTLRSNVRVIAATNRNLEEAIQQQRFREDLYYRLNVFPIHVPPLRERRSDILLLADAFADKYAKIHNKPITRISSRAIDVLMAYHWPGNVRELENAIERAVLLTGERVIHSYHLPPSLQTAEETDTITHGSLEAKLSGIERDLIEDALKSTKGNVAQAARALKTTERKIGLRIKKLSIDPRRFRPSLNL